MKVDINVVVGDNCIGYVDTVNIKNTCEGYAIFF